MNLREQELFYAAIEGKHCAIDDDKDRGFFWININQRHGRDSKFWINFTTAYNETLKEIENERRKDSSLHSINRI